jgi:thioredoxin reductase (NADPH)
LKRKITAQIIVVGGGLAGLSASIYLGRALRDTLVIDNRKSMARWEPDVENYLGFPDGIAGKKLLRHGRRQARNYHVRFQVDKITSARRLGGGAFTLQGEAASYRCERLLLATGIYHIPPDIRGVRRCLGHSMFFCKDCDGHRVRGKTLAIYGWTDDAAEYALGMLPYSSRVSIVTDTRKPRWNARYGQLLKDYRIEIYPDCIEEALHRGGQLEGLRFSDGRTLEVQALFTTRGDIYLNKLAKALGARVDSEGQVEVDPCMQTSVKGLYAAGCVTPANCQMIIAAGQGAIAAQSINRDLFLESLRTRTVRRAR